MALEVTQQQVDEFARRHHEGRRFNLATETLERLLVVGLEWTKDAAQTADELAELLAAQCDSQGLGFVALGTPTNNTEASPAGYNASEQRAAPLTPSESAQLPKEKDALQLLTYALGIAPDSLPADNIINAHLPEQRTALHMMNLLWRGTFGNYLMELWNPYGDDEDRPAAQDTDALCAAPLCSGLSAPRRPAAAAADQQAAVWRAAGGG